MHPKKGSANNKLNTHPLINVGHKIATVLPNTTTVSQVHYHGQPIYTSTLPYVTSTYITNPNTQVWDDSHIRRRCL